MSKSNLAIDAIQKAEVRLNWRPVPLRWNERRERFFRNKYKFDLYFGWFLLLLFAPLIVALWLLVKLTSKGPGFYRQDRVGLNQEVFELVKLRSMRVDAESEGQPVWCSKNDSRMTWLGKILRKLHLDELPQLLNVARGEMSLVGPRPERPIICKQLSEKVPGYYGRVRVKPGITGLSQINLPPDENLADVQRKQTLDLQYIAETNLWLEFRILFATALRIVGIKGEIAMRAMFLCRRSLLRDLEKPLQKPTHAFVGSERRSGYPIVSEVAPLLAMYHEADLEQSKDLSGDSFDSSSQVRLPR